VDDSKSRNGALLSEFRRGGGPATSYLSYTEAMEPRSIKIQFRSSVSIKCQHYGPRAGEGNRFLVDFACFSALRRYDRGRNQVDGDP